MLIRINYNRITVINRALLTFSVKYFCGKGVSMLQDTRPLRLFNVKKSIKKIKCNEDNL